MNPLSGGQERGWMEERKGLEKGWHLLRVSMA
jgi:hypothetical protein